jgi:hypothetical protein
VNSPNNTRRYFIRQGCIGIAGAALLPDQRLFAAIAQERRTAATLDEAFQILGFDSTAADAFTAVWLADVHYGVGEAGAIMPPLLAELHRMRPRPAFIGVIGDLVQTASLRFGRVPDSAERRKAIAEFRAFKSHFDELATLAPVKLTLGNHDTYPGENDIGLFRSVFGSVPVTHAFEVKGVTFVMLNGGNCGLLDQDQQSWFRESVKKFHRPGGTLIIAVHQPSLGRVVRERGISEAVRDACTDVRGNLWLVGGHVHRNGDSRFRLPHGQTITQATITAGNPIVWGTERPGYWIWCFKAGRVVGRVFRQLADGAGFAIAPPEAFGDTVPLLLPFEERDDVLWKVLIGEGDEPYRRVANAVWCLNYWVDANHLEYEFPLSLAKGLARRCGVLIDPQAGRRRITRLAVSSNGQDWQDIETAAVAESCTTFDIPHPCFESGRISLRMENCAVSGFALLA